MRMTGKRNPFKNHYEVGFDAGGKILALKAEMYSDGGAYADLSTAIMERAMLHCDNAYFIPHFHVTGQVCKTHTAPNTAFRGFGGPKGVVTIENIIEQIAATLKMDSLDVRQRNVYKKGDRAPYGQEIEDNVLVDLFAHLRKSSRYDERRTQIRAHNSGPAATYRGLSLTAVKFGISFTTRFLNQGSALVNVHMDGSVQVSTGATEMGQGVNVKIAQVVADAFSIPASDVRVMPTSTEKNANTSPTAASSGSDINGRAAEVACEQIKERLAKVAKAVFERPAEWRGRPVAGAGIAPEINIDRISAAGIKFENGSVYSAEAPANKISFRELLQEAYLNRVSLSANGYYRYPEIHFNKETGQGKPFYYYTNGVAASEVSVDRLTGEVKVLRTDILIDLGRPVNEGIDHGQVTGGFIQGMGWVTTENLFYSAKGELLTFSPSTYKIPNIQDIPREFNVSFFPNDEARGLKGSKAVGEPPLILGISVWTAVRDALCAQGKDVNLRVPATQETVFMNL
jgi:xanthine dehydrogenase large subunit